MKVPTIRNVLFLEDDADTRELVAYTLNQAGINVISAETVAEAWQAALANDIDLFLLDGLIPNGDSMELCRDLRRLYPLKPIIFYSGLAYRADILCGLDAGATAYFVKPYSGDLAEEILSYISEAHSRIGSPPLFLNRDSVMKTFESEDDPANGDSVKIIAAPAGYTPTSRSGGMEPQPQIPQFRLRNMRTIRAARGIF